MRNYISRLFLGIFLMLGVSMLYASNERVTRHTNIEINKAVSVFINDATIPDVSPQYGKAHFVHANSDLFSTYYLEITPRSNSPPLAGITGN